ncbi:signal recognition particle protein [bacterium]|nr:signal recognition particle protein [bacterium]
MFDSLSGKLCKIFRNLKGYGRLSESNIKEAMREIKLALLEADVNYRVVKDFVAAVKSKAVGKDVIDSITPGQQVVKIVHDELVNLMGGTPEPVELKKYNNRLMLVGLQGSGKTTTAAKLASYYRKKGHNPLLVGLDVQRPAAIDQLVFLAKQLDIPVFYDKKEKNVVDIAKRSLIEMQRCKATICIFDTAGRLHIDQQLMDELADLKQVICPQDILFVADAMTGQDAVTSIKEFNEKLSVTGVAVTKLDGDARGGAALSIKATTGCPIRFVGLGEKISDFDVFYPDRMASRILGMGDIVSLVEKAQEEFDEKQAVDLQKKIKRNEISLEDFLQQLKQIKKLGPLENIMSMIPGMGNMKGLAVNDKQLSHIEAVIQSMTRKERLKPQLIDLSRKKRISAGSGTSIQEVNQLLKNFMMMKKMMKKMMSQKHKIPNIGGKLWR